MHGIEKLLTDLTFEGLEEWAGHRVYSRGEEYIDRVKHLSRTADGAVAAWVLGTAEYVTMIHRDEEGALESFCTCPYDGFGPCKHAVAVILAASQQIRQQKELPLLDAEDDLHLEVEDLMDDFLYDEETDEPKIRDEHLQQFRQILSRKSKAELEELLISLAREFPPLVVRVREDEQLASGEIGTIVRSLRREIRNLTAEDVWYNSWQGEGNLPDYSKVERKLHALVAGGHGDQVLDLGEELWRRGIEQVEMADDDGETAREISSCMAVVLKALPCSSLSLSQQLVWLLDRELEDEYSMLPDQDTVFDDERYTATQWQDVAEVFGQRLEAMVIPRKDSFSSSYKRRRHVSWLIKALERSGRQAEVIPLLEREVVHCDNYDELVEALMAEGRLDHARHWCLKGYENTYQDKPGIASGLKGYLRDIAEEEGRLDMVCAYRAEDFFTSPSEQAYCALRAASERLGGWPQIRGAALAFLESGVRPETGAENWPLPSPEVKEGRDRSGFYRKKYPDRDMLIEIALLEGRLDESVAIYRQAPAKTRWGWGIEERLAKAVAESDPEVALTIWRAIAEGLIDEVKPSSYQQAAPYLKKMRTVYFHTGREPEWQKLLTNLRTTHKRKRRLLEVLDRLENTQRLID